MIQEDTYKVKFNLLKDWSQELFQAIKKDVKNDYLRNNPSFMQKHFAKKAMDKLTVEEIAAGCLNEIEEGNEEFGEWVVSRWVVKNAELYQFFASELSKINPQFDQIESISDDVAEKLLQVALESVGPIKTYIFTVLNSVRFSDAIYSRLKVAAEKEKHASPAVETKSEESVEAVSKRYEATIQKLTDKYEKRLQGVEKKYFADVEGLKKQISQLHKRLGELQKC